MRNDLVLQGGGVKGVGLVGAYAALTEAGWSPYRVAGTSAGAIVGALIAAGYTPEELHTIMRELDYGQFEERTWLDRGGPVGEFLSLLTTWGIYKGDALRDWLHRLLAAKGIERFADLRLDGDDPGEQPWKLVVMTSDITRGQLVKLPWDYPAYGLDPDEQLVADAVRCSMSIPYYFQPVKLTWHGTDRPTTSYLVDGGMLSNFPVEVFDRLGEPPRWPTFGIMLSSRRKALAPVKSEIHNVIGFTRALVTTATGFYDQMHLGEPSVVARTVFVDTMDVRATDFDLDRATQDKLYRNGYDAGERFLEDWTFAGYLSATRADVGPPGAPSQRIEQGM